jgi:hypothetical protein
MPNAPLLAFLAAAQVATSTAPDPDAAARATWLMPLVAALPVGVGLAGVGPGSSWPGTPSAPGWWRWAGWARR